MSINADGNGKVSGKIQVPPNIKTGTKLVEFFGSGGSHGNFLFESKGEIWQETKQNITTNTVVETTYHWSDGAVTRAPGAEPINIVRPTPIPVPQPTVVAPAYNATITVNNITANNIINYAESRSSSSRAITGTAGGDARVGDIVSLTVGQLVYTGKVKTNGTYSINVPNRVLSNQDTGASITATITSPARGTTPAGSSTTIKAYSVDSAAVASVTLNVPTLSAKPAKKDIVTLTGTAGGDAAPGDKVKVTVGTTVYTAIVAADLTYSVQANASKVSKAKKIKAAIKLTDIAGNPAKAATSAAPVLIPFVTTPPALTITNPICNAQDPLAQTFTLETSQQVGGVEIFVVNPGTTPVTVSLRKTSNGVPVAVELARRTKAYGSITANTWTRFEFFEPVMLVAGEEYAIVVLTDNGATTIGIAELGKWDTTNAHWVTSQPYTVGTLLSSSNASTWTPHQDADMTFRLLGANYTVTTKTIVLGEVYVSDTTDFLLTATSHVPSEKCTVRYFLTLPDTTRVAVIPFESIKMATKITGVVKIEAELTGTATESPIVEPGAQLLTGQYADETMYYITRGVPAGTAVKVVVLFDASIPSGSTVVPTLAPDGDTDTWTSFSLAPTAISIASGWNEYRYQFDSFTGTFVHLRLALTGTPAARPMVKNLRVIVL